MDDYPRATPPGDDGIHRAWLIFDEAHTGKPSLLRALEAMEQYCVGELPANFLLWTRPPKVL